MANEIFNMENEEEVKPVVQNIADVTCNHLQHWKDTGQI